jgi:hypothetical protein
MVIVCITIGFLAFRQIILNVLFEVSKLSVGDKHVCIGGIPICFNAQNFDLLSRITAAVNPQALKGKKDIWETKKMNL